MKDLLKWALILGGGYLLLKNTKIEIPGLTSAGTAAGGTDTGSSSTSTSSSTTSTGSSSSSTTQPAPPPSTPAGGWSQAEKEALFAKAAAGDTTAASQVDQLGWKLNSDQWNFYRLMGGGGPTTADLFPEGDRGYLMTAAEYLERRHNAGLGAYGRLLRFQR